MQVIYRFDWDAAKERINVRKHDGITFSLASSVLHDPLAITIYDDEHSDSEERWVSIGQASNGQTMVVIHTYVPLDASPDKPYVQVRLISARKADKQERKDYEQAQR